SPAYGDAVGSRAPAAPAGSPSAAPDWPRADAARADTPGTAVPAPGADAPTGGADARQARANDAGASKSGLKQATVGPGVPRNHDEGGIVTRLRAEEDVKKMTVGQATEAGCPPCRACQPGTEAT